MSVSVFLDFCQNIVSALHCKITFLSEVYELTVGNDNTTNVSQSQESIEILF